MFLQEIKNLNIEKKEVIVIDDSEIVMETCLNGKILSIGIGVKGNYSFKNMSELKINEIERIIKKENGKN